MGEGAAKRPLTVGLTGSIGMGKSETAKMFLRLGVPVYDADAAVHALYERGGAAVQPIAKIFPEAVSDGRVDRVKLAQQIGGSSEAFEKLEAIVHPLVLSLRDSFLNEHRNAPLVVLDIPLLFEAGLDKDVDAIVVVSAPAEIQRARVMARPGMSAEKFEGILARQVPDAEKRAKADFVIETDQGLEHAFAQVQQVVAALKARLPA
jgi:dephospho-CoA kinase